MRILIVLFFLFSISSFAQNNELGLSAGPTISIQKDQRSFVKPSLGLFYAHSFHHLKVTIEPSFTSTKSWEHDSTYVVKATRTYFQIPVTIGYYGEDKFIYGAYLGMYAALGKKSTYNTASTNSYRGNSESLGLLAGAAFGYNFNERIFSYLSIRYVKPYWEADYWSPLLFVGYKF